jgi:hypothetical protein
MELKDLETEKFQGVPLKEIGHKKELAYSWMNHSQIFQIIRSKIILPLSEEVGYIPDYQHPQ